MRKTAIILLLCCSTLSFAQDGNDSRTIYDIAEADYQIGRLEQAQEQLTSHLKEFDHDLLQSVYRLLALCQLGMDEI